MRPLCMVAAFHLGLLCPSDLGRQVLETSCSSQVRFPLLTEGCCMRGVQSRCCPRDVQGGGLHYGTLAGKGKEKGRNAGKGHICFRMVLQEEGIKMYPRGKCFWWTANS